MSAPSFGPVIFGTTPAMASLQVRVSDALEGCVPPFLVEGDTVFVSPSFLERLKAHFGDAT